MSRANLRVVRLLDREIVPIVKGIPIPRRERAKGLGALARRTLRACAVGDSFLWHDKEIYRHARAAGIKITARRAGAKWRVWRVS